MSYNVYKLNNSFGSLKNPLETIETSLINGGSDTFVFSFVYTPAITYNNWFYVLKLNQVITNFDKTNGFRLLPNGSVEYWRLQQ